MPATALDVAPDSRQNRGMFTFDCIVSDINPGTWDIVDQDGKVYRWGGDLYGALGECLRLAAQANA